MSQENTMGCMTDKKYVKKAKTIKFLAKSPAIVRYFKKPFVINSDRLAWSQTKQVIAMAKKLKVKVEIVHLGGCV